MALDAKLTKPADAARRAVIAAQALGALGRDTEALALLNNPAIKNDPAVLLETAQVLADQNRMAEVLAEVHAVIAQKPDSIAGHYWLGAFSEQAGDEPACCRVYLVCHGSPRLQQKMAGQRPGSRI